VRQTARSFLFGSIVRRSCETSFAEHFSESRRLEKSRCIIDDEQRAGFRRELELVGLGLDRDSEGRIHGCFSAAGVRATRP